MQGQTRDFSKPFASVDLPPPAFPKIATRFINPTPMVTPIRRSTSFHDQVLQSPGLTIDLLRNIHI